jgi:hypothetical protein
MTFAILSLDFEQVSAPAGLAAGGTSQCERDYTRKRKIEKTRIYELRSQILVFSHSPHPISSLNQSDSTVGWLQPGVQIVSDRVMNAWPWCSYKAGKAQLATDWCSSSRQAPTASPRMKEKLAYQWRVFAYIRTCLCEVPGM